MEYADMIDQATMRRAVDLTQKLASERDEPLQTLAAEAVGLTFCSCVTAGEDAAEHRFSAIHRELIDAVATAAGGDTLMEMTVTGNDTKLHNATLRDRALARWDNEGGARSHPPARPGEPDSPALTNAELVQLRVRVIALENIVIALLAGGEQRQGDLVREMAALITPRAGSVQHPLTVHAAGMMADIVHRADHFQALPTT